MQFSFSDCGGCRSCELACSYHKYGEFDIKKSAIIVNQQYDQGCYTVILQEPGQGASVYCDGCKDEDDPVCIRYCHSREELKKYVLNMRDSFAGGEKI